MSTFDFQQPVEQLYAFMDGELDSEFEQQLFSELARNQDLRTEMKDLLTLRQAVQHDVFVPSPFIRERLLTAVGFAGSTAITLSWWQQVQQLLAMWVKPMSGAAFGAGVTALLMTIFGADTHANSDKIAEESRPVWTLQIPMDEHSTLKTGAVGDVKTHITPLRFGNLRFDPGVSPDNQELPPLNSDLGAMPDFSGFTANAVAFSSPVRSIVSKLTENTAETATFSGITETSTTEAGRDIFDQTVSFRARALFNYSYPATALATLDNSWINNAAFGAMYHFNSDLSAGVEIGMERFAQVFGSAEGASEVWYEQNPQMLWAGVMAQYNMLQIEPTTNFHLYGETFIGAAGTLGLLGRQSVGLNFSPVSSLTISAAAEAAVLPYLFKGTWFSTEKAGFTFGLSFTPQGLR